MSRFRACASKLQIDKRLSEDRLTALSNEILVLVRTAAQPQDIEERKKTLLRMNHVALNSECFQRFTLEFTLVDNEMLSIGEFKNTPFVAYLFKKFEYNDSSLMLDWLNEPAHQQIFLLLLMKKIRVIKRNEDPNEDPIEISCLQYLLNYAKPKMKITLIQRIHALVQDEGYISPTAQLALCRLFTQKNNQGIAYVVTIAHHVAHNLDFLRLVHHLAYQNLCNERLGEKYCKDLVYGELIGCIMECIMQRMAENPDNESQLLQSRISRLTASRKTHEARAKEKQTEILKLKQSIEEFTTELEASKRSFRASIDLAVEDERKKSKATHEIELETMGQREGELNNVIAKLNGEFQDLSNQYKKETAARHEQQKQIAGQQKQIAGQQKKIEELNKRLARIPELKIVLDDLQKTIVSLKDIVLKRNETIAGLEASKAEQNNSQKQACDKRAASEKGGETMPYSFAASPSRGTVDFTCKVQPALQPLGNPTRSFDPSLFYSKCDPTLSNLSTSPTIYASLHNFVCQLEDMGCNVYVIGEMINDNNAYASHDIDLVILDPNGRLSQESLLRLLSENGFIIGSQRLLNDDVLSIVTHLSQKKSNSLPEKTVKVDVSFQKKSLLKALALCRTSYTAHGMRQLFAKDGKIIMGGTMILATQDEKAGILDAIETNNFCLFDDYLTAIVDHNIRLYQEKQCDILILKKIYCYLCKGFARHTSHDPRACQAICKLLVAIQKTDECYPDQFFREYLGHYMGPYMSQAWKKNKEQQQEVDDGLRQTAANNFCFSGNVS